MLAKSEIEQEFFEQTKPYRSVWKFKGITGNYGRLTVV